MRRRQDESKRSIYILLDNYDTSIEKHNWKRSSIQWERFFE